MNGAKLDRKVVRIGPEMSIALDDLAVRLFNETQIEHPHTAIVRGLMTLGLSAIADLAILAPSFVGARIARGRKPGTRIKKADARDELAQEHDDEDEEESER
jgi:hypothetical protein